MMTAIEDSAKILHVVVAEGPVTPERISEVTGFNRSAVHRSLKALESSGIVRPSLGRRGYRLTAGFADAVAEAASDWAAIEACAPVLANYCRKHELHADIYRLAFDGEPKLLETTDPDFQQAERYAQDKNYAVSLAVYAATDRVKLVRTLMNRRPWDPARTRDQEAENIVAELRDADKRIFWSSDHGYAAAALADPSGEVLALRVRPRPHKKMRPPNMEEALSRFSAV